jgi:hypothetical protein
MSYYHQNPDYNVYTYKYDLYSDHYEPDHCGFEGSRYNNVDHEDSPKAFKYGHGEPEGDGYEPMEPSYEDGKEWAHWEGGYSGEVEGYKHNVEDKGDVIDETHKHHELVYEGNVHTSRCTHVVTTQNGFEVVHGFSHQNEKVYSIPNHCQLATLTSRIQHHFTILTSHHSKTITTHHSIHYLSHDLEA